MSSQQNPRPDNAEWEMVMAELTAAMHAESVAASTADAMPADLAERVVRAGAVMVQAQSTAVPPAPMAAAAPVAAPAAASAPAGRGSRLWQSAGWLAAAAVLVVSLLQARASTDDASSASASVNSPVRSPQALRTALLSDASDVARLEWAATTDSSAHGASGDVVWSAARQAGVMRLVGLLPNDRTRWQYQLWIFDKQRDERYPVDGGVFDVPAGSGEVLVPITARVPVGEAVMFAVTVEAAGGVVVSTRERVALLAKSGG